MVQNDVSSDSQSAVLRTPAATALTALFSRAPPGLPGLPPVPAPPPIWREPVHASANALTSKELTARLVPRARSLILHRPRLQRSERAAPIISALLSPSSDAGS